MKGSGSFAGGCKEVVRALAAAAFLLLLLLAGCAALRAPSTAPRAITQADLDGIEIDFDWGTESEAELAFGTDFRKHLAGLALEKGLTADSIVLAFDTTVQAWLPSDRREALGTSGEIEWYDSALDLGDGNLLHVDFTVEENHGYVAEKLEITRPGGLAVRAWVYEVGRTEPVFASPVLPVPGFGVVEVEVGGVFDHLENIEIVRLILPGPDGRDRAVYRCFPRDNPAFTVFSFQNPQDIEAQEKSLEPLEESIEVDDRWILSDPDEDLARLYQQISIVRASQGVFERVERLVEVLAKSGEEEFLATLASVRFPGGVILKVERESYREPVIRVTIEDGKVKLVYWKPVTLDEVYASGAVEKRWVEKARAAESFNFGSWLPDLWRGANEELFASVYRMNRAKSLAAGRPAAERALFDQTVRDLTAIGVYFDSVSVRIAGSEPYRIDISEGGITSLLASLGAQAPPGEGAARAAGLPALPQAPTAAPGGQVHWDLQRYQEAGMTFVRDHALVYYEIEQEDVRGGAGLEGIRAKLRSRFPGRYDYSIAFSGFRDEHLRPGMLLVVPGSPEARALSAAKLKALVEKACGNAGFNAPELVYAIVWNESRAGKDNFFRFEAGRVDAVTRLGQSQTGQARKRFDEIYGRFGYLLAGSYGPGHILYENAWKMGFRGSPGEFATPEINIPYIVRYLVANGVDGRTSIEEVSRIYNGPGFRKNGYHLRLKQNIERAERAFRAEG